MRSFEERKEEIFRRSQKRIAQQKKAVKRTVFACVPVVLCLTVLSGYAMIRGPLKMDSAAPEAAGDYNCGSNMEDVADMPECMPECPESAIGVACMQVSNGAENTLYSDAELLQVLQQILDAPKSTAAGSSIDSEKDNNFQHPNEQFIEDAPYSLLLIYQDGTQLWYTLQGNRLTCEDGTAYLLTTVQSSVLHARVKGEQ